MASEVYFQLNQGGGYGPPPGFTPAPDAKFTGQYYDKYVDKSGQVYQTFYGTTNNPAQGNSYFSRLIPIGQTPGPDISQTNRDITPPTAPGQSLNQSELAGPAYKGGSPIIDQGSGPTPLDTQGYQPNPEPGQGFTTTQGQINQAAGMIENLKTVAALAPKVATVQGIGTPAPAPTSSTTTPTLPTPTALTTAASAISSATTQATTARTALEQAYSTQLADIQKQKSDAQAKIDSLNTTIKSLIDKGDPTKTATYEQELRIRQNQLDSAEAASKTLQKNFEDNQALTNELDGLLTQGNQAVEQQKQITGLAAIRNPIIQDTINKVNARAGVIQAVMAARNGQINQAYDMINQSSNAVNAAKKDELNYLNTLISFYDNQKNASPVVTGLNSEERKYIDARIGLLENDLKVSQSYAENIKKAMIDPSTAMLYAKAGVTLTDSPEQVAQKIATQQKWNLANGYNADGTAKVAPTASTLESQNLTTIQNKLLTSKGADGYVNPNVYLQQRTVASSGPDEFDKRFSYLLSPTERQRLGIRTTEDFGVSSAADQAKAKNWLLLQPGHTADDLTKLQTDPAFFAWVLQQASQ